MGGGGEKAAESRRTPGRFATSVTLDPIIKG